MMLAQIDRLIDRASNAAHLIAVMNKNVREHVGHDKIVFSDHNSRHLRPPLRRVAGWTSSAGSPGQISVPQPNNGPSEAERQQVEAGWTRSGKVTASWSPNSIGWLQSNGRLRAYHVFPIGNYAYVTSHFTALFVKGGDTTPISGSTVRLCEHQPDGQWKITSHIFVRK